MAKKMYETKSYENADRFWIKATDKVVDLNIDLPENASSLDDHCFQCIVAGGKYTQTVLNGDGKCNRGTGTTAENAAKPAVDKTLKTGAFMSAVKSCAIPNAALCTALDKQGNETLRSKRTYRRYFGTIVEGYDWGDTNNIKKWDHCFYSFELKPKDEPSGGYLFYNDRSSLA